MIRGLEARARLPRLGVIRLGVKVQNLPKEVDYFVLPADLADKLGELQPKKLAVLFPSDEPARVLTADYVRYAGPLLTLKCDGERFTEIPKQGAEITGTCRKEAAEAGRPGKPCACGAKAMARLNVIVLDGPLGVYQVLIGGEQRIADLMAELAVFRKTLGRLTDIVFEIERVETSVQIRTNKGERLARTGWPVHIRCHFTAKQALFARGAEILALSAGTVEEHEDEDAAPDQPALPQGQDTPAATPTVVDAEIVTPAPVPEKGPVPEPGTPTTAGGRAVDPATGEVTPTIKDLIALAQRVGVEQAVYLIALEAKYPADVAAKKLTDAHLREEHDFLSQALQTGPAATGAAKAAIKVFHRRATEKKGAAHV